MPVSCWHSLRLAAVRIFISIPIFEVHAILLLFQAMLAGLRPEIDIF